MKKTIFMMSFFLALTACQKETQTISIPPNYTIQTPTYLYVNMETCIRHARKEVRRQDLQDAQETNYSTGGFMVAGTVEGLGPVIFACHAGPGDNATFATFIKAQENRQEAEGLNADNKRG